MVLGRDTVASFLRDSNEVTVLLGQGSVSVFHDVDGMPVRMKIGNVSVVPVSGFKTLGEVAMLNGTVVVTAKEGMLRVEGNSQVVNVAKGKTITVVPEANAPQQAGGKTPGGAGRCCTGGVSTALEAGALGAGITAAILAGVAVSRSGNATSAANSAIAAAETAASNAAAAESGASAAVSAANSAASAALYNSIALGCALDTLASSLGRPSPYTPPSGYSCSNPSGW
jgi:hypothetical protein